jgi:nucleoside-diphosphate-sugar epimerase
MFHVALLLFGLASTYAVTLVPRLLVLGLGNVGRAVVHEASSHGAYVQGTSRSPCDDGKTVLFEPDSIGSALIECTHVLITIPPPRESDPVFDAVVRELEAHFVRGGWLGFVSTSGVYGNHDSAWVTEESPLLCSEDSPTYRYIRHEELWRERAQRFGWTFRVFRCAGLYGPERSALHTLWKKRTMNVSPTAGLTNRIHEADVARAIVASMAMPSKPGDCRVYCLADDEPESRAVVMQYAADLFESIGITVAVEEASDSFPSTTRSRRRGREIKRVSNQRMTEELLSNLHYPTYREGLTAIFQDRSNPWCRE